MEIYLHVSNSYHRQDALHCVQYYSVHLRPFTLGIPSDTHSGHYCQEELYRGVTWSKTYSGGVAVEKCPEKTKGMIILLCLFKNKKGSILLIVVKI